jgi:hypothetical protein
MARQVDAAATRQRILTASGELMRRHGYAGTGIKAILAASAVPYGSLYYHFLGASRRWASRPSAGADGRTSSSSSRCCPRAPVCPTAVAAAFADAAELVASTDYADACPVATIAGEIASTSEPMRSAAAAALTWARARSVIWSAGVPRGGPVVAGAESVAGAPPSRARKRLSQPFEILDGDRQRGVAVAAERRGHLLAEVDAHAGLGVRSEREPVVHP